MCTPCRDIEVVEMYEVPYLQGSWGLGGGGGGEIVTFVMRTVHLSQYSSVVGISVQHITHTSRVQKILFAS